jgi:hypothetical protein
MTQAQDDAAPRRAILARADANPRHAILARSVDGTDHVAAAERVLEETRGAARRVAGARPRGRAPEPEGKSWGSH